jgi:hypothetical protein
LSSASSRYPELALFLVIARAIGIGSSSSGSSAAVTGTSRRSLSSISSPRAPTSDAFVPDPEHPADDLRHDHRGRHGELTSQEIRA